MPVEGNITLARLHREKYGFGHGLFTLHAVFIKDYINMSLLLVRQSLPLVILRHITAKT